MCPTKPWALQPVTSNKASHWNSYAACRLGKASPRSLNTLATLTYFNESGVSAPPTTTFSISRSTGRDPFTAGPYRQTRFITRLKPGFHYPNWRPELPARVDGWLVSITHAELTGCQHGRSTRLVEMRTRQHGPCWWVMETGHPSTRAGNLDRQPG